MLKRSQTRVQSSRNTAAPQRSTEDWHVSFRRQILSRPPTLRLSRVCTAWLPPTAGLLGLCGTQSLSLLARRRANMSLYRRFGNFLPPPSRICTAWLLPSSGLLALWDPGSIQGPMSYDLPAAPHDLCLTLTSLLRPSPPKKASEAMVSKSFSDFKR